MKQWLERLNDPGRDIYERRYRLLSAISIVVLFIWILVALLVKFHVFRTLFFLTCDLLFIPTMIYTLRSGKIQLGAGASGVVLVFTMIPVAFFYNGGITAGAPNWCIIALIFITLTVQGRLRAFLLISDLAVTAGCYMLTYFVPGFVEEYSTEAAYVDSLASLTITGLLTSSMFLFQLYVSKQERMILEKQSEEIEELNRAQSSFFSSMSHEIRTPVNTIIGLNEVILREADSAEILEDARSIEAAGKMLLQTVNDILEMSRLESGTLEIIRSEYKTGDMLSDIVNMIWVKAQEKGLNFRIDVDPHLPSKLIGDEMRIRQILLNVLTNAVKYTEKGEVTLSIQGERMGDGGIRMLYTVADTGIGIRKENIPYLFTAFKRVDEYDNQHIEGTGLGLSIVKELLDLMGGTIHVNSIYTKGSTFLIELPQEIADEAVIGQISRKGNRGESRKSTYRPVFTAPQARILVVDDTPPNLMVVEKLLRNTKVQTDTADSGREALEKTLKNRYDVIFMDHLMPEMDGIECLHQIRIQPGGLCRDCKIVALTANAGSEMDALYRREGFDGYLVKPIEGKTLEQELLCLLPADLIHLEKGSGELVETDSQYAQGSRVKKPVAITTDSSCDLPGDLIRDLDISVIPFYVRTENALFLDGIEAETVGLSAYMERGKKVEYIAPETEEMESFFADNLLRANHIIHITASRDVSKGQPVAVKAAETFHNVTVFDGGQLSSGTGLLAIYAAEMARDGHTVEEILQKLKVRKDEISTSFVIDKIDYLVRTGRTGEWVKMISAALLLHPEFQMVRGRLRTVRLFWGNRERLRKKYITSVFRRLPPDREDLLFVTHVGLSAAECRAIVEEAQQKGSFRRVIIQNASTSISTNCGPGTFGLLYRTKKKSLL